MSVEGRGWRETDLTICVDHLLEPYLRNAVGEPDANACAFCGRQTAGDQPFAVAMQDVMEIFMASFWQFYGRFAESPVFGNEAIDTEPTADAVAEIGSGVFSVDVEAEVLNSITARIDDDRVSTYNPKVSDVGLSFSWDYFVRIAQYGSRFVLTGRPFERSPMSWVSEFLDELTQFADHPRYNLVRPIPQGSLIYRSRLLRSPREPFADTEHELGAPGYDAATAGRMSPAGIRMFYGAASIETAIAEVAVHDVKAHAQVGTWHSTRELRILDLTQASEGAPSIFDPAELDTLIRLRFLKRFAESVARPIVPDGRQHTEYAPTQILTEYFRYVPRTKLDGIAYLSAHTAGTNYALFIDPDDLGRPTRPFPLALSSQPSSIFAVRRHVSVEPY